MTKQRVCKAVLCLVVMVTVFANGMVCQAKEKYKECDTPTDNSFKSYMSYKAITDKSSPQYKLQKKARTGKYGIRTVNSRYCIALGSYYTTKIGTKVNLVMENGFIVKCILADQKSNQDTDSKRQKTSDGSIVEFIVDTPKLHKQVKRMGDISYCNKALKGQIRKIRIYY